MFGEYFVSVVISGKQPYDVDFSEVRGNVCSFGRNIDNDIVLDSPIVSSFHGKLIYESDTLFVVDNNSTNGVFVNGERVRDKAALSSGDSVTVESGRPMDSQSENTVTRYGVTILINTSKTIGAWAKSELGDRPVTIGRNEDCDIVIKRVGASRLHAKILWQGGKHYIFDNNSTNGVFVNGARVEKRMLAERDIIYIANTKLVYSGSVLYYSEEQPSYGVDVVGAYKTISHNNNKRNILDNVSVLVKPNEFVAIIGGSGAGKSTLLNVMCGYSQATQGSVMLGGEDLYKNYEALKNIIGYVPQQDIVYSELTLYRMLMYTAEMRMPEDSTSFEREKRIAEVLVMVELTDKKDTLIKKLSGGQRKRASIAVELVSDPSVFFLDEPSSGLDPGTERNLMNTLKKLTRKNKTIILVTHMTANIGICDKVAVMGQGGRLCFYGKPEDALTYFNANDYTDIYDKINNRAEQWQARFRKERSDGNYNSVAGAVTEGNQTTKRDINKNSSLKQLYVLCRRYAELVLADRKRTALLLLQAPLLGLLLALVSYHTDSAGNSTVFAYSGQVKSLLFSLSCAAFWIGMLNAVQEICKERDITRRERMAKLKLVPYILSKLVVLGMMCVVQSAALVLTIRLVIGLPARNAVGINPFLGLFLVVFITAFSATALGLLVSGFSPNPDRAMTLAPLILMPQILFSGVVFELEGFVSYLSGIINCKWSVRAFFSLVDINALPYSAESTNATFSDVAYTASKSNFYYCLAMLLVISIVCVVLCIAAQHNEPK